MADGYTIFDDDGDEEPEKVGRGRPPRRRDALAGLLRDVELWRSPDGIPHASLPVEGRKHREHVRVGARDFRNWLMLAYLRAEGRGLSGTALAETTALAEAQAMAAGHMRRPWRRVALGDDGAIYLDLGGGDPMAERRAVEITPQGWRVIDAEAVSVPFLRNGDAMPLPEPEAEAANIETLRSFVNVVGDDDLALAWAFALCALRPFTAGGGAYPLLLLHGEQGTGKSLATRFLSGLIDPSGLTGRALPREERDLFVSAASRHLVSFDNISGLGEGMADSLCRIATGGGFSARALHTDADEVILSALKPVLLNGIPATIIGRPDLASRALSLELARIGERRPERDILADYDRALPGLLGLVCDGLSAALRNLATTTLHDDVRMIDAATWAEAAAPGLGIPPGRIAAAWVANRTAADRALVESDDLALALVVLLRAREALTDRAEWKGTPAELLRALGEHATADVQRGRQWPRSPSGLGVRLKRLAPPLRVVHGIDAQHGKAGADGARFWVLRRP